MMRLEHGAGGDQGVAGLGIGPTRVDGEAGAHGLREDDGAAVVIWLCLLDGDDGVVGLGHRGTGRDFQHARGGVQAAGRGPGGQGADDGRGLIEGDFGEAYRVAIHRRSVERRQVAVGDHRLGQHAADQFIQWSRFGAEAGLGLCVIKELPERFVVAG